VSPGSITTNILDDRPVLLATLTPPVGLSAGMSVRIAADVTWLVCEKQCLREQQAVSISVPVATSPDESKPANESVFARARRVLPVAGPAGKFITLKPALVNGKLAVGATFTVQLDVEVKKGFHVQSNAPRLPGLFPTDAFMDPAESVWFNLPEFPEAEMIDIPKVGKTGQFGGQFTVRVPAEVEEELAGDSRTIGGVFVSQACNDKTGTCAPPEGVEWSVTVPVGTVFATAAAAPTPARADAPRGAAALPDDKPGVTTPQSASEPERPSAAVDSDDEPEDFFAMLKRLGTPGLLLACFLYGLFLNATPCVLPLLSIKVLGFVQQAHESRSRTFGLALAFGVGVLVLFAALGFLAAGGQNILQFPVAVIALSAIVMALALSMLGVYTLQVPTVATKLDAGIRKEGVLSSFAKGALAPVLGFACTGPLLAGALAWASQQPPRIALLAFLAAGFGMASPYILMGANPNWLRFLPRPGNWMITFERIMGFLLLAMVVWLMNPLVTQIGPNGVLWTMVFFVAVGMACGLLGKINYSMPAAARWRVRLAALATVALAALIVYGWAYPLGEAIERQKIAMAERDGTAPTNADEIPWRRWSPEEVEQAVNSRNVVFVDFTAAYCTVCKANKAIAIDTAEVRSRMRDLGVVAFRGDFTFGDEQIAEMLKRHDRIGVPLNLIYPPGRPDDPIVLRPNLTKQYLLDQLASAAPSTDVAALNVSPSAR